MVHKTLTAVACGVCLLTTAQAKDVPFDFTHCYTGLSDIEISETGDDKFYSFEMAGVIRSNSEAKTFDNATSHCVGVIENANDDWAMVVYCKLMSPDKDWIVYKQQRSPGDDTWDWVVASSGGKWKGATGTGASTRTTKTEQVKEGTSSNCNQHVGTLTLPD